jgi:hypothetical protein
MSRDKSLTFFGLMWLQASLAQPRRLRDAGEWRSFFQRLTAEAESFRKERSEKLASRIVVLEASN